MAGHVSITIPSNTAELEGLREFVKDQLAGCPFSRSERDKVILAVDEAVSNIIIHAYDGQTDHKIELEFEISQDQVTINIRDSGRKFDPKGIEEFEITEHVRAGRRRGLGIFMMRRIMDEVHYNFKEGVRNELVLTKKFVKRNQG